MPAFWKNVHLVAHESPGQKAIIAADQSVSYGALSATVNAVTRSLRSKGVQPGDRVALLAFKNIHTVAMILGALQAGAVVVPINPLLKRPQVGHILNHCTPRVLLCPADRYNELFDQKLAPPSLQCVVLTPANDTKKHNNASATLFLTQHSDTGIAWSEFLTSGCNSDEYEYSSDISDDVAAILYTSGSTGTPKGVVLTRSNLHHGALSVSTYLKNTAADRILGLMPLSFDYGLSQLTTAMHAGACLVLHDYYLPKGVIEVVLKYQVTGLPAVPHLWDQLMAIEWPEMEQLRYVTSTGGSLQQSTIDAISKRLNQAHLYSMYGFTEAFRATYLPTSELKNRSASIGKAVPYASIFVVDSAGKKTAPLEHGEIIQSGPLVSAGYWNDIEGTREKFRPCPGLEQVDADTIFAWSGDMGYTDSDGYIYFVSRIDDMVKLNGHRVSPSEIEKNLVACEWLQEVCVLCIPHPRFGHVAIAFVVSATDIDSADLNQWSRQNLPNYMVPAQWYLLDELPSSPNEKVDRKSLLQEFHNGTYAMNMQAQNDTGPGLI